MDLNQFPNDPWVPFFGSKSLPEPETHESDTIVITGFNVERCQMVHPSKGLIRFNRYHPAMFQYKRAQDGAGHWVWTWPKAFNQDRPDLN